MHTAFYKVFATKKRPSAGREAENGQDRALSTLPIRHSLERRPSPPILYLLPSVLSS